VCDVCGLQRATLLAAQLTTRSAADADYERSIAMFLHATAAAELHERPDIAVKWVHASELCLTDEGVCRDRDGTRVRCVWKSAPWNSLLHLIDGASAAAESSGGHGAERDVLRKLLFSPDVHVYQVSGTLAIRPLPSLLLSAHVTLSTLPAMRSLCGLLSSTTPIFLPSCAAASPTAA